MTSYLTSNLSLTLPDSPLEDLSLNILKFPELGTTLVVTRGIIAEGLTLAESFDTAAAKPRVSKPGTAGDQDRCRGRHCRHRDRKPVDPWSGDALAIPVGVPVAGVRHGHGGGHCGQDAGLELCQERPAGGAGPRSVGGAQGQRAPSGRAVRS